MRLFRDYLESTATKRNVTGPYAKSMYPPQHGLTYRMQYSPESIPGKKKKKRKRKKRG